MAKQIKAVKCPSCGDSNYTEYTQDKFKCSACGTVFFIDSDDVNININHNHRVKKRDTRSAEMQVLIGVLTSLGALVLIVLISWGVTSLSSSKKDTSNKSVNDYIVEAVAKKHTDYIVKSFVYEDTKGRLIHFSLRKRKSLLRQGSSPARETLVAVFFDFAKEKVLTEKELMENTKNSISTDALIRHFDNETVYLILNKNRVFEVQMQTLETQEVTKKLFENYSEFETGISTIEFTNIPRSKGFKVMNNVGDLYYYYPKHKMLNTPSQEAELEKGMKTLLSGAKEVSTFYFFSSESIPKENTKLYLYQVNYKDNDGGPAKGLGFYLSTGFAHVGNGIFEVARHGGYVYEHARITSYKPLTKDRFYFSGKDLFSNSKEVIIRYKAIVSDEAPFVLQSLNSETGEINWTRELADEEKYINRIVKLKDGDYLIEISNDKILYLDFQGKTKKIYQVLI